MAHENHIDISFALQQKGGGLKIIIRGFKPVKCYLFHIEMITASFRSVKIEPNRWGLEVTTQVVSYKRA